MGDQTNKEKRKQQDYTVETHTGLNGNEAQVGRVEAFKGKLLTLT